MNGSEAIVRTLQGLGVDVIFGLCGDTTLPLYEALYDIDHGMRHVLTRDVVTQPLHEANAPVSKWIA